MPRCRICKTKFEARFFNQKSCLNETCVLEYSRLVLREARKKADKEYIKINKPITHAKKYKSELQREINKLARMIDTKFNYKCIDCGNDYGKQADGCHFKSVGANNNIRYNLHNIHKGRSDCNMYSDNHKQGYEKGIVDRYGFEYLNYMEFLPLKYPYIKLTEYDVVEKLAIVRKLIREFDNYDFKDGKEGRDVFNKIIGIYE